jgi:hypothetical protein
VSCSRRCGWRCCWPSRACLILRHPEPLLALSRIDPAGRKQGTRLPRAARIGPAGHPALPDLPRLLQRARPAASAVADQPRQHAAARPAGIAAGDWRLGWRSARCPRLRPVERRRRHGFSLLCAPPTCAAARPLQPYRLFAGWQRPRRKPLGPAAARPADGFLAFRRDLVIHADGPVCRATRRNGRRRSPHRRQPGGDLLHAAAGSGDRHPGPGRTSRRRARLATSGAVYRCRPAPGRRPVGAARHFFVADRRTGHCCLHRRPRGAGGRPRTDSATLPSTNCSTPYRPSPRTPCVATGSPSCRCSCMSSASGESACSAAGGWHSMPGSRWASPASGWPRVVSLVLASVLLGALLWRAMRAIRD